MAKGNRGGKRAKANKVMFYQSTDALNLTQTQIDAIDLQRASVFQGAYQYSKDTAVVSAPTLTGAQRILYDDVWENGNYDALKNKSTKTLTKLYEQAQYDYDSAQRTLAKGIYDVKDDYMTRKSDGKRVPTSDISHFPYAYEKRQKSARIVNELYDVLENKGVIKQPRNITSSTYNRIVKRIGRQRKWT